MLDPCVSQGWLPTRNMSVMVHRFSVALTCGAICMQQDMVAQAIATACCP